MTPPDMEISRRLLARVPYRDRLSASRLLPPVGIIPGHVRSLHELHLHLAPDERSLPGINLAALEDWAERVIGDEALAGEIRTVIREAGSYAEACFDVHNLVGLRLEQAREVAGQEVSA
jgi:hypothetical protein